MYELVKVYVDGDEDTELEPGHEDGIAHVKAPTLEQARLFAETQYMDELAPNQVHLEIRDSKGNTKLTLTGWDTVGERAQDSNERSQTRWDNKVAQDMALVAQRAVQAQIEALEGKLEAAEAEARRQREKLERAQRMYGEANAERARLALLIEAKGKHLARFEGWAERNIIQITDTDSQ